MTSYGRFKFVGSSWRSMDELPEAMAELARFEADRPEKAKAPAIDPAAIYKARAAQVEQARAERAMTEPKAAPLTDSFAEQVYAARRQAVGESDA
jgi:hypothetical protein